MALRFHDMLLFLILEVLLYGSDAQSTVGDRVVARWTDNLYYAGKVESVGNGEIVVLFDDNNKISHSIRDISAVIADKPPNEVRMGQHVIAAWEGGNEYYLGYVSDDDGTGRLKLKVTFDDNKEDYYAAKELLLFPDQFYPHEVGARVFAPKHDGSYCHGFVFKIFSDPIFLIKCDDGGTISFGKDDIKEVILDMIPCYSEVHKSQRVIGFWKEKLGYYPGVVTKVMACCYKAVYHVEFNNGTQQVEDFNQIRFIPI